MSKILKINNFHKFFDEMGITVGKFYYYQPGSSKLFTNENNFDV